MTSIPPVVVNFQTTGVTPAVQQINRLNGSLAQAGRTSGTSAVGLRKLQNGVVNLTLGMVGLRGATGRVVEGLLLFGGGAGLVLKLAAAIATLGAGYAFLTKRSREQKEETKALVDSYIAANRALPGEERIKGQIRLSELRAQALRLEALGAGFLGRAYLELSGRRRLLEQLEKAAVIDSITLRTKRLDAQKDALTQEFALQKEANATLQQANERQFAQSLQSQKLFFERKRGLTQEATAAEVKALQGDLRLAQATPAFSTEQRIEKASKLAEIEAKIAAVRIEGERKVQEITAEEFTANKALALARLSFEQQIQAAKGRTLSVAVSAIEEEARKFEEVLVRQGVAEADRTRILGDFRETFRLRAEFAKAEEDATRSLADLDRERLAISNQVATGKITEFEGQRQIAALELQRLPALRQMAEFATKFAESVGDPALIAAAADLRASLDGVAASADLAGQRIAQFKADVESGLTNDLSEFFSTGITEAKNFGDAIRGLGQSIAQTIQRIVAELIAAQIVRGIASAIGFSGGGPVSSSRGNQTQSGFAAGGYVSGPGTGTSDSIPARLSDGEYVVNARSTRQNFALLEAINAQPFHMGSYRPGHYAAGGLVASTAASFDGRIVVELADGLNGRVTDGDFMVLAHRNRKGLRGVVGG